jgi:hypothetical protein
MNVEEHKEEKPEEKPKEKPKRTRKPKSGKAPGSKLMTIEKGNFVLVFD